MQDRVLVPNCKIAGDFFSRFFGLMGRRAIGADEAILFPKCDSIHTFFMRFAIDVVMVDREGRVIGVKEAMAPWRLLLPRRGIRHIIELGAHRSRELGITTGTMLQISGVWP